MAATTSVVLYDPQDTSPEVQTLAGFLAGYSGRTREAYTLDLRMFYRWCEEHRLGLFDLTRTHIELYARELEDLGRKPATIGRRLSTITSFYRYATEEAVSNTRPRCTSGGHASITSPTPSAWTATSSARSSSPPDCPHPATTPSAPCWR